MNERCSHLQTGALSGLLVLGNLSCMTSFNVIFTLLCAEQEKRKSRPGFVEDTVEKLTTLTWVIEERRAVLAKVNEIRGEAKLPPIDEEMLVRKAEWQANGHFDYTSKYALYAAELTRPLGPQLA